MKKRVILIAAIASLICVAYFAGMASNLLVGALAPVNGTTNSVSVAYGTLAPIQPTFFIQNGGVATTNELTVIEQLSMDNVNFTNVATYNPSITNATTDTWRPALTNQNIYMRVQIITTNLVNVGVTQQ